MGSEGTYIHFGFEKMVLPVLNKFVNAIDFTITLKLGINIDGLHLAKSSKSQVWPILVSIINCKILSNLVFPIGIYHGTKKPPCIQQFLHEFIIDLKSLLDNGFEINGNILKFEIGHMTNDAPAKSFILNVKGHNAYFGCTTCAQEGSYKERRVVFLEIISPVRTNESFRNKVNEEYHKGDSPLELLPINIIDVVCLDYMHNVCIGVTKRLVEFWVKGKKNIRLNETSREKISTDLINLRVYVPNEFSRLPRKIEDIDYWKATELRSFILYFGPIVLKGKLNKQFYSHFMLLSCAIKILVCPILCETQIKLKNY